MKDISLSNYLIKCEVRMNYSHEPIVNNLYEPIVNNLYEPIVISFHKRIVYLFLQNDRKLTNV